jgi:predicted NBD/HSP70 family sugar kinase
VVHYPLLLSLRHRFSLSSENPDVNTLRQFHIMSAGDQVLKPLEAALAKRLTLVSADKVTLVKAALGGNAGAIGAALAARVEDDTVSQ